jgi:transcription elongation factor SPT5
LCDKCIICFFFTDSHIFSSQKEDEIEEYLRKKYADESVPIRHFGDGGEEMSDEITQQTLLPGVK